VCEVGESAPGAVKPYEPKGARRARQRGGNLQSGWGCQDKTRGNPRFFLYFMEQNYIVKFLHFMSYFCTI